MGDENIEAQAEISLEAREVVCMRDERELFAALSFRLSPGQVLLLEGRNGSGKTTFLRILCGIRAQDAGTIYWCGEAIDALGSQYHRELVYVGHLDAVKRDLTVLENLRMAQVLGRPGELSLEQGLARVGLGGFEDMPVRHLSAGQRRRLALARLLVTEARLWVLDEPFTSLDRESIVRFERLIAEHTARSGMVVMTSHHDVLLDGVDVQRIRLAA